MREIKFRVWCKENEQFIQFNKMGFLEDGSLWYVQGTDENEKEIDPPYFENRDGWELMQYTGLKDKNGVEIYEGDIVKLNVPTYKTTTKVIDTLYDAFVLESNVESSDYIEILGNIYENPELLEREAE